MAILLTDLELVARVSGSGDQAAFQLLVERHQSAIRGFLSRLLNGDHGSADDLSQDTFLMAYRKIHTLKSGSSIKAWLHSIAYRQFLQFTRKNARQVTVAEIPDQGQDPRQANDAEILAQKLMAHVSPEQRACMTLAYSAGMSHPEISEVTGFPPGTVKSHIQRGKQKLQQWLEEHDHYISENTPGTGPEPEQEAQSA